MDTKNINVTKDGRKGTMTCFTKNKQTRKTPPPPYFFVTTGPTRTGKFKGFFSWQPGLLYSMHLCLQREIHELINVLSTDKNDVKLSAYTFIVKGISDCQQTSKQTYKKWNKKQQNCDMIWIDVAHKTRFYKLVHNVSIHLMWTEGNYVSHKVCKVWDMQKKALRFP